MRLKTRPWKGFSELVEGEFLQAVVDGDHAGAPGADPFDPANTFTPDPETNELKFSQPLAGECAKCRGDRQVGNLTPCHQDRAAGLPQESPVRLQIPFHGIEDKVAHSP